MKYNLNYIAGTIIKTKIEEESQKSHFYSGKLSHKIITKGIVLPSLDYDEEGILPGGIIDKGDFVESSAYAEYCCKTYPLTELPVTISKKVLFIGFFLNCYGHGITDNIKKLWWLKQNTWDGPIIYICERNKPLSQWQIEIFRLAGFDTKNWEQVIVPTQYDEILIPDNSIINDHEFRYYTEEYRQIINTIKQNTKTPQHVYDKIYFTRTGEKNVWREFGEHFVETAFRKNGYTVISPEKLPVEEQIGLMKNCKTFVSTEGSCAHNSVFCSPDTQVVILRKADYANSYQIMINEFADLDITYIDIHHSSKTDKIQPWHGPFYLYITKNLAKYLKLRYNIPYWAHFSYWVYRRQAWGKYGKYILK